jgi:hypothetical protein
MDFGPPFWIVVALGIALVVAGWIFLRHGGRWE